MQEARGMNLVDLNHETNCKEAQMFNTSTRMSIGQRHFDTTKAIQTMCHVKLVELHCQYRIVKGHMLRPIVTHQSRVQRD